MTGEVVLADVGLGFGDDADKPDPIQNPDQARTNQLAGNSQCWTVVKFARENSHEIKV
jgi:hypothetical protein